MSERADQPSSPPAARLQRRGPGRVGEASVARVTGRDSIDATTASIFVPGGATMNEAISVGPLYSNGVPSGQFTPPLTCTAVWSCLTSC